MLKNNELVQFFEKVDRLNHLDGLWYLRNGYHIPNENGVDKIYFCGNSLGLQPKTVEVHLINETKKWAQLGVNGHFEGVINWFNYHSQFDTIISKLTGAKASEIVVANALTVNLHLLFSTFYKPTKNKFKIIIESPSFSSDYYAVCSQIENLGLNVEETLVEVLPRLDENYLHINDILNAIETHSNELAMVWIGAVNFYTGQFLDINSIVKKAHSVGAMAGFDLAHAIGNVPLELHSHQVDFATWCSYKYLNSGPGGVSGIFIHEKHHQKSPAFKGWWGVNEKERFKMSREFTPMQGAKAWQLSNAPILSMAVHKAALDEFNKVEFHLLRERGIALSELLIEGIELIISLFPNCGLQIITPKNANERGCQVSILTDKKGKQLFDYLIANNIIVDWREPNVIRMAAVPMYNNFEEIGTVVKSILAYYSG